MMQINIIMPTYNDSVTIIETLDSLKCQTFTNWHLTIVNDGSIDNTRKVVLDYIKENNLQAKITYLEKENGDQLNAIKYGLNNIKTQDGLIYICHSDDLIYDASVFQKAVNYFQNHEVDAIISNLYLIDDKGNYLGMQKVSQYVEDFSKVALQALWLGRNLYTDVAFFKMPVFKEEVLENYLTWNTPFWLTKDLKTLNVQNVSWPFMKYRLTSGNYINNELGLLNVLNGECRCALNILKNVHIYCYRLQYYLFRLFHKLHLNYHVIYTKKEAKHLGVIVKFILKKRLKDITSYPYYNAILNFFINYPSKREITLQNILDSDVFYGSDMRKFNTLMLNKKLSSFYLNLFKEMHMGFKYVYTTSKDLPKVKIILEFLDILKYVEIIVK